MGGLRDTFAINETRAFADKLEVMAHEIHCEPLSTYADLKNTSNSSRD